MGEYHGVDKTDVASKWGGENGRAGAQEIGNGGHVTECRFSRGEFLVDVVVGQGVGNHAVGQRVNGEQKPEFIPGRAV